MTGICKGSVVLRSTSSLNRPGFLYTELTAHVSFVDLRSPPSSKISPDRASISPGSVASSASFYDRIKICVGLGYSGCSTSGSAYVSISFASRSNVALYANVCHSLYRLDPTDTYPGDRGIIFSVIYKANGAP